LTKAAGATASPWTSHQAGALTGAGEAGNEIPYCNSIPFEIVAIFETYGQ
jgi:hypothetical protein